MGAGRKKSLILLIPLLIILLGGGILFLTGRTKGSRYSELLQPAALEELRSGRTADVAILKALYFDDTPLFRDRTDEIWYHSVPEGASGDYDPVVRIEAAAGARIAFAEMDLSAGAIEEGRTCSFVVYTNDSYYEGRLCLTTLPLMRVSFDAAEISEDDMQETPVQMMLCDNRTDAVQKTIQSGGLAHVRGNMTREFLKKGYRLTLLENKPGEERKNRLQLLGMREESDWILYPAYNDQEKVRNVFSSMLWETTVSRDNAFGYDTGMEYRYVELFLNDRYWGLYALGYPISASSVGLEGEYGLYKATRGVTDENRIYFIEDENGVRLQALNAQVPGKETRTTKELWDPILSFYCGMYERRFEDEALKETIDMENALDYYLFVNLTQGQDQTSIYGYTNRYMAVFPEQGVWKCLYIPWDMDRTWGNSPDTEEQYNTGRYAYDESFNVYNEDGPLHQLLLNGGGEIRPRIAAQYAKLRSGVWSDEAVTALLDGFEADIYGSGAFRRDLQRWPEAFHNDPSERLDRFREYVFARLHHLDDYYADPESLEDPGCYSFKDFEPAFRFYTFPDTEMMTGWFGRMPGCHLLVQVNDGTVWDEERFCALLRAFGLTDAEISVRPELAVFTSGSADHTVVSSFSTSGTVAETILGGLAYYVGDGGYYGIYQDGKQIFAQDGASRGAEPFRLIFFSPLDDDAGDSYDPHIVTQTDLWE